MGVLFLYLTVLVGIPLWTTAQQQPSPPLVAPSLPPSPDPSTFVFRGLSPASSPGDIQLLLGLTLFGSDLLPYRPAVRDAITIGFQQTLQGTLGANSVQVEDVRFRSEQQASEGSLQYLLVDVVLVTDRSLQGQLQSQLQATIQDAQLAGQMRVGGLYNLQRLSVNNYSLSAYAGPAPAPAVQQPSAAIPSAFPLVTPSPGPVSSAPSPEPAVSPTPAPSQPAAVATAPVLAPAPVAGSRVESPATAPSPVPPLATAPTPAVAPPAESPAAIQATAPAEVPSAFGSFEIANAPAPVIGGAEQPAEVPAPVPASSPPAPGPSVLGPEPSQAPDEAIGILPGGTGPAVSPVPAPAEANPISQTPVPVSAPAVAPAPSPNPGQVNVTVQLNGASGLNSTGAAALEAVLANLTGQGAGSVMIRAAPPPAQPSTGRRLLQLQAPEGLAHKTALGRKLLQAANNSVPVTINAADYQQVLQNLGNLSSGSNLTSALQQAGINVTNAQITYVNGRQVINAQAPGASLTGPAPAPHIPVPHDAGWKNKAVLWGVLGGVAGLALLAAVMVCMGARYHAARIKRQFPPAKTANKEALKGTPTTATSSSGDIEEGVNTPQEAIERQTAANFAEGSVRPDASQDAMVEVNSEDEDEDEEQLLMPLPPLTTYNGQFNYIVPSENALTEANIAEVPVSSEEREGEKVPLTRGSSQGSQAEASPSEIEPIEEPSSSGPRIEEESREAQVQVGSHAVMQLIASGKLFADRFALEDGCIRGSDAIVAAAKDTLQGGALCMCKFITSPVEFTKELHLHELFADNLSPLPAIVQSYPLGSFPRSGLPSAIITEGGDYSLSAWHSTPKPPNAYQKRVIFHLACKALARLHQKRIVLGSLTPDNVLWFEEDEAVKISSFSFWAFDGTPIPLHPALRYAAPETVQASARGKQRMPASFAIDIWSLGTIAFSIFARAPVFGSSFTDVDVIQCLLGNCPLPWEMDSGVFEMITNKDARNLVKNMLRKDPSSRWTIEQVLDSAFFNGLPSLPYKPSLSKNPSYPKQAVPLVTMNPLSPLRNSEASLANSSSQIRKLHLDTLSPVDAANDDRLDDTAREMEAAPKADSLSTSSAASPLDERSTATSSERHEGLDSQPSVPQTFENAIYLDSQPSTSLSETQMPVDGILARDLVRNPAFSAEARPLPSPQNQQIHRLSSGGSVQANEPEPLARSEVQPLSRPDIPAYPSPAAPLVIHTIDTIDSLQSKESVEEKAEVNEETGQPKAVESETSSSHVLSNGQRPQSSGSQQSKAAARANSLADEAGSLSSSIARPAPLAPAARLPTARTDNSLLLKTLSVAGGHSRAGSVAGWESLEGYENAMSELTSETSNLLNMPFGLKPIPFSALPTVRGSVIVMGISIEEIQVRKTSLSNRQLLEGVLDGSIATSKAPMVPNKGASMEHPVFMMRLGAKFVFRLTLLAGSRRGGVPLGLTGPVKMRIGFARSDEGDSLEIKETETTFSKWKGLALWDSSTPRVAQLAGKFGQQTRMVVTTDCQRKNAEEILSIEHEIYSVMCTPGQRIPAKSTWSRGDDFNNAVKGHAWAQEATNGALSFYKVGRQRNRNWA